MGRTAFPSRFLSVRLLRAIYAVDATGTVLEQHCYPPHQTAQTSASTVVSTVVRVLCYASDHRAGACQQRQDACRCALRCGRAVWREQRQGAHCRSACHAVRNAPARPRRTCRVACAVTSPCTNTIQITFLYVFQPHLLTATFVSALLAQKLIEKHYLCSQCWCSTALLPERAWMCGRRVPAIQPAAVLHTAPFFSCSGLQLPCMTAARAKCGPRRVQNNIPAVVRKHTRSH